MNNLISKAIQAIKDQKIDYALGILESVMEMGDNRPVEKLAVNPLAGLQALKAMQPAPQGVNVEAPTTQDEGSMLDAMARAAMGSIKTEGITVE